VRPDATVARGQTRPRRARPAEPPRARSSPRAGRARWRSKARGCVGNATARVTRSVWPRGGFSALWLLDAWSSSGGVDAVVTAFVFAASRPSVSATSDDRTDASPMRSARLWRRAGHSGGESTSPAVAMTRLPGCLPVTRRGCRFVVVPGERYRHAPCSAVPCWVPRCARAAAGAIGDHVTLREDGPRRCLTTSSAR
jgi:hypothetical protein